MTVVQFLLPICEVPVLYETDYTMLPSLLQQARGPVQHVGIQNKGAGGKALEVSERSHMPFHVLLQISLITLWNARQLLPHLCFHATTFPVSCPHDHIGVVPGFGWFKNCTPERASTRFFFYVGGSHCPVSSLHLQWILGGNI